MIYRWLSAVIGVLYMAMGVFVFCYKNFIIPLKDTVAYALGLLLLVYGAYRVVRVVRGSIKREKDV